MTITDRGGRRPGIPLSKARRTSVCVASRMGVLRSGQSNNSAPSALAPCTTCQPIHVRTTQRQRRPVGRGKHAPRQALRPPLRDGSRPRRRGIAQGLPAVREGLPKDGSPPAVAEPGRGLRRSATPIPPAEKAAPIRSAGHEPLGIPPESVPAGAGSPNRPRSNCRSRSLRRSERRGRWTVESSGARPCPPWPKSPAAR